jgi:hypothetical protein
LLVMSSNSAYLTAEKGVKGRWSKDWLRSWLPSEVRRAHQWMLLTKFESPVQQALLLVNSWCCLVQVFL